MESLIQLIQKEWVTLSSAPGTFILLAISAFAAAILAANWRYNGIVESLKERIENLNSRLEGKDEQLSEYRERLHLTPAETTSFGRMSNKEVKTKALDIVSKMRAFLQDRESISQQVMLSRQFDSAKGMTEEQRQKQWNDFVFKMTQDSLKLNAEYDSKFKTDTLLLRDELISRLPKDIQAKRSSMYEHPTNPIGMKEVADDLEMLAKKL